MQIEPLISSLFIFAFEFLHNQIIIKIQRTKFHEWPI